MNIVSTDLTTHGKFVRRIRRLSSRRLRSYTPLNWGVRTQAKSRIRLVRELKSSRQRSPGGMFIVIG